MIYKGALAKTRCPLRVELEHVGDINVLPVDECEGTITEEWTQDWWLKNLRKHAIGTDINDLHHLEEPIVDEAEGEDFYGSFE